MDDLSHVLETIEVETGPDPRAAVIWLHGLGADGHDFEPLVPELAFPEGPNLRFVFPHAPVRPVTINGGMAMRAWYDILSLERDAAQDESGIRHSRTLVEALIRRENQRGIPAERLILAGFSQGGVMSLFTGTRYAESLAGIMGLSCYLPLMGTQSAEAAQANANVPMFLAHGTFDPMLPLQMGQHARDFLGSLGHEIEWHEYPMAHAVCPQEVEDIRAWLLRVLKG